jgi:hypothetical protein
MVRFAGVMIDSKRAIVVRGDSKGTEILHIDSALDDRARVANGDGDGDDGSETQREGLRVMQLRRYFDRIVDAIRGCNRFIILGPDDMKVQLRKHLDRIPDQAHRIVAVKTVKKMSDNQLVEEVTSFFRR